MNPLLPISYIFLFSSLLSATIIYREASEIKHPDHIDIVNSSKVKYNLFATYVDALTRTFSARLLTSDARLVVMQQNIIAILKLLFDNYHLSECYQENVQVYHNERLRAQNKSDTDEALEIFNETFIRYDDVRGCLIVTKVVLNRQENTQISNYYSVNVQLPSTKVLYSKMIAQGIGLNLVLRMLPRIINLYEVSFKCQALNVPDLTKAFNNLFKKFIWKHCQAKNEKIAQPSPLTMRHIAKKFFKKNLGAQLHTIKQGHKGHLFAHIFGEPCTVHENRILLGIGYLKDHIKLIEQCELSAFPSTIQSSLVDGCIGYCIYAYNPGKDNKTKVSSSKEYKQETAEPHFSTAIPMMRVPKDTIMSTYIIFPKKCLVKQLETKQNFDSNNNKRKINENQDTSCTSSEISDEQLLIFMNHFANYIHTNASKLF